MTLNNQTNKIETHHDVETSSIESSEGNSDDPAVPQSGKEDNEDELKVCHDETEAAVATKIISVDAKTVVSNIGSESMTLQQGQVNDDMEARDENIPTTLEKGEDPTEDVLLTICQSTKVVQMPGAVHVTPENRQVSRNQVGGTDETNTMTNDDNNRRHRTNVELMEAEPVAQQPCEVVADVEQVQPNVVQAELISDEFLNQIRNESNNEVWKNRK
jgi:hypothetical protein